MPTTRPPYPAEFRTGMVRLVRAGRTPGELSREFEPSDQTIRNWVNQADVDGGHREGLTTAEREELRRENRIVWRREREPGKSSGLVGVTVANGKNTTVWVRICAWTRP